MIISMPILKNKLCWLFFACFCLLFFEKGFTQQKPFYELSFDDTYIVKIDIGNVVAKERNTCLFGKAKAGVLVKVKILDLIYASPNAELDSLSLLKVAYMAIMPGDLEKITDEKSLIVSVAPLEANRKYILFTRMLKNLDYTNLVFRHSRPYPQYHLSCLKKGYYPFKKYFEP